ncbi:transferase [Pseudarthrobacter sulfonivorans]|uniref:Gluconokinase n=1 Tax=Pseudarthrobacter sulfonivorans TaxID=121292 RepID=A0A0U3QP51_9MICC|nr:gluconokinase [Pseudarthrobacter sulfonivorans]ALV41381.1 transferase [Pseudarthrobacter sulfonivorans]
MSITLRPMVVMGVSGSGKSVLGAALGQSLGIPFIDADDLHPASNKALMAAGTPLTDENRIPWLNVVAGTIAKGVSEGHPSVVACSALKRAYRDLLRSHVPDLLLIYIDGAAEIIAQRLETREHEFMPATLLASQLATLETPIADEAHIRVPAELTVEEAVDLVRSTLRLSAPARQR